MSSLPAVSSREGWGLRHSRLTIYRPCFDARFRAVHGLCREAVERPHPLEVALSIHQVDYP